MEVRVRALLALPGNMKLQRDIFLIVALVCHLQATAEADKLADTGSPAETYDKNLIQVVDDSVISRFDERGGRLHLESLCYLFWS